MAPVTRDEILRDLLRAAPIGPQKVLDRTQLLQELESRRRLGQRIAFTNGCFDVLHAGHVQYLQEARAQADLLVVGNVGLSTIAGRLLGSVPANVARRSKTDVLIVHTS